MGELIAAGRDRNTFTTVIVDEAYPCKVYDRVAVQEDMLLYI